jgi:hypothetical protein
VSESTIAATRPASAGNAFTRKLGPLPLWGWMGIGLALGLVYYFWQKNKASAASNGTASSSATGDTEPADQTPPYIIQNYSTDVNAQTVTPPIVQINPNAPPTPPPPPTNTKRPTKITATGTDTGDINQIAKKYGLTEQELIAANPQLKKLQVKVGNKSVPLIGSGAPVPKGTQLTIPAVPTKKS